MFAASHRETLNFITTQTNDSSRTDEILEYCFNSDAQMLFSEYMCYLEHVYQFVGVQYVDVLAHDISFTH